MTAALGYPYADGDLLEQPAQYSYSRFGGLPFLAAWSGRRADAAAVAGAAPQAAPPEAPVLHLLQEVARGLAARPPEPAALDVLHRLLQRFEVTKRLHGAYGANWRPLDAADYRDPERYLRFAELLEQAYAATAQLPCLNGLLKCMDTLCSLAPQLDATQAERFRSLVTREQGHVQAIAARHGIAP
jgi:methionyl-tRNA formyltransferase